MPRERVQVLGPLEHLLDRSAATWSRRSSALVQPPFELGARCVRGRRGVRGAAAVPDDAGAPPPPRGRVRRRATRSSCRCRGRASMRRASRASTSSGAPPRRCCATCTASCAEVPGPALRRPGRIADASADEPPRHRYHRRPMSFFAVLFALMIEQLRPLPRDNWVHDGLHPWVGWTGRHFDAGARAPCLGGVVRLGGGAGASPRRWCTSGSTWHTRSAALALRRGGAVPDARLSPVQPLLHRHPQGARRRATKTRRGASSRSGATSTPASCRAPSCCAT